MELTSKGAGTYWSVFGHSLVVSWPVLQRTFFLIETPQLRRHDCPSYPSLFSANVLQSCGAHSCAKCFLSGLSQACWLFLTQIASVIASMIAENELGSR